MLMSKKDIYKHYLDDDTRIKVETALIDISCIAIPRYWVIYNYFYDDDDIN